MKPGAMSIPLFADIIPLFLSHSQLYSQIMFMYKMLSSPTLSLSPQLSSHLVVSEHSEYVEVSLRGKSEAFC